MISYDTERAIKLVEALLGEWTESARAAEARMMEAARKEDHIGELKARHEALVMLTIRLNLVQLIHNLRR